MANYLYKIPPYDLPISHNSSYTDEDGRTDRRQQYHKLDRYLDTIS